MPELNSLAIQCNPYIIEMLQNIAGFSRVAFISWQTLIWSFSMGSIIVAPEEYEEWNARLTQFKEYLDDDQQLAADPASIFIVLNSGTSELPLDTTASHVAIKDNGSGTVNADTTDFPPHRYVMVRIRGVSKGREHDLLLLKSMLRWLQAGSHVRPLVRNKLHKYQHSVPTNSASPFEQRNRRYYLSSSPSWYHSAISPSNPLSYLSPLPSTASTPSLNQFSEAAGIVGETTGKLPPLLENDEEEIPAKDGGDLPLPGQLSQMEIGQRRIDISLDWPPLSDENAIAA